MHEAAKDDRERNEVQDGEGYQDRPKDKSDVKSVTGSTRLAKLRDRYPEPRCQPEICRHAQKIEQDPLGRSAREDGSHDD